MEKMPDKVVNKIRVLHIDDEEDFLFLTKEYVEGETLDKTIAADNLLPLQDAISIAIQIADGLGAAHKKDVVHRDIKASNILLGEANKAKILDLS